MILRPASREGARPHGEPGGRDLDLDLDQGFTVPSFLWIHFTLGKTGPITDKLDLDLSIRIADSGLGLRYGSSLT